MACKDDTRTIGDRPVYVRQWPATTAIENLSKGIEVFGAAFGPFVDGDADFAHVLQLLHGAKSEDIMPLLKEYVCCARIDGVEVSSATFNQMYNGELDLVFKVFGFVCEVQYKDFFEQGLVTQDK